MRRRVDVSGVARHSDENRQVDPIPRAQAYHIFSNHLNCSNRKNNDTFSGHYLTIPSVNFHRFSQIPFFRNQVDLPGVMRHSAENRQVEVESSLTASVISRNLTYEFAR